MQRPLASQVSGSSVRKVRTAIKYVQAIGGLIEQDVLRSMHQCARQGRQSLSLRGSLWPGDPRSPSHVQKLDHAVRRAPGARAARQAM